MGLACRPKHCRYLQHRSLACNPGERNPHESLDPVALTDADFSFKLANSEQRFEGINGQTYHNLARDTEASGASEEVAEAACLAAWRHAVGEAAQSRRAAALHSKTLVVVVLTF